VALYRASRIPIAAAISDVPLDACEALSIAVVSSSPAPPGIVVPMDWLIDSITCGPSPRMSMIPTAAISAGKTARNQ
jgi:hypothetical protein